MRVCERYNSFDADAPAGTYRLGVFGGTFDPIHVGHLAAGERVRESLGLDAVVFMPDGEPVFKKDQTVTPGADRLEMCRLATQGNDHFDVSAMEIERAGDTYTVDTLKILREHYPKSVEIFFITGADAIMGISGWREADHLAQLARFVAITRPGYDLDESRKRLIAENLRCDVTYLCVPGISVSSSMLRDYVAQGRSIRYLTADAVCEFIRKKRLYIGTEPA